jgi:branched-subunit amino acid ABC-type transport system permease component
MDHNLAYGLQQALNAMQLAAFYMPLALAFALIQAVTRRIFLGFGDFAMFGSFVAIYVCFDSMLTGRSDLASGATGLVVAMACGAALGLAVFRLTMTRALLRNSLAFMIGSIGVAIVIQELMRIQSGAANLWIPPLLPQLSIIEVDGAFPVRLGLLSGLSMLASALAVIAVFATLQLSRIGLHWRASAQHPELAGICGVDVGRIAAISFALAGLLAGLTGWTSAIVYGGASFSTGLVAGFKAMFAAVVGGFGSLRGAVVGAMLLALGEVAWSALFSTAYRDIAVFCIIVVVLVLRPQGLFGTESGAAIDRGRAP